MGQTYPARAILLDDKDREHIFSQLVGNFQDYKTRIAGAREIPVFELRRLDDARS
jgi:hypothetical protein